MNVFVLLLLFITITTKQRRSYIDIIITTKQKRSYIDITITTKQKRSYIDITITKQSTADTAIDATSPLADICMIY
jgi:hypothetical protein